MRMERVESGVFYRRGCEYIQEWVRMVSEYTGVVANSFGWALRTFIVVSGVWLFRVGLMVWTVLKIAESQA